MIQISKKYWYPKNLHVVKIKKQMQKTSLDIKLVKQKNRSLFNVLLKLTGFLNKFEKAQYMSFIIKDKKLHEKYESIGNKISNIETKCDKKNNQWLAISEH